MEMAWVWTGMVTLSLVFGLLSGNLDAVANAALEGARSAIELSLSMAGILCLWSGVMEIMNACGLSAGLARLFRPLLRRLLPNACRDEETLAAVSANVSANLLGLGNAACLTMDSSRNAIDMVSDALKSLSARRSIFGALQNRMEHAVNSNENTSENTTAAVSRIRDTDMAEEMVMYSNRNILLQSGQAMLAQANQSGQGILSLLAG